MNKTQEQLIKQKIEQNKITTMSQLINEITKIEKYNEQKYIYYV